MKWLITGGCGFVGRSFAARLLGEQGHAVRVFDNLSTGKRSDLATVGAFSEINVGDDSSIWQEGLSLQEGDILDECAANRAVVGADVVVHLAANTGVPQSVEDPMADCRTNIIGIVNMLEACRKANVPRFVFASSGAPLGVQIPPLHEELAPHPASPYGASKLAGEGYCSAYFHCFGIDTVTLRFGNVYGEGSGRKDSVVAKFIKLAMAGEVLEIYGNGAQTRDFVHITDLVQAIRCAAETANIGGETFQIASAKETTVSHLTDVLLIAMRKEGMEEPKVVHGSHRQGDVARNFSDTTKAKNQLGWTSKISLEDGLRDTIRYFLNRSNR